LPRSENYQSFIALVLSRALGFYYKPIAEGKNVWLLTQAACCAVYFIAIILVTMGVRRSTQAISS
jgi:hypothetical protein